MNLGTVRRSLRNTVYRGMGRASGQIQKNRALPVDVLENDDSYLVVFDAPGAEKEDVQVRYLGGSVKVRIDRYREFREGFDTRFPGRSTALDGEASLPDDAVVAPDAGTARLTDNGALNIEIPKSATAESTESAEAADDTEAISLED